MKSTLKPTNLAMLKLAPVLSATLLCSQSVAADTTQQQMQSVAKILHNSANYKTLDLVKSPNSNYYLIKTQINNAEGYFLLDTGAYTTALSHQGAKALGLTITEAKGESFGVGGASKNYTAKINNLVFAGSMKLPNKDIRVLNIPALNGGSFGKLTPMGILGSDILDQLNMVLHFRTHKLYYPTKKGLNFRQQAEANGYKAIPFIKGQNVPTLNVELAGKSTEMVFDSGAQSSIIDLSTAQNNKMFLAENANQVRGAGATTLKTKATFAKTLSFGDTTFTNFAASSIQLRGKIKDIDGIIGADLLFSGGVIFDYASDTLLTEERKIQANDLGLVSTLPMSNTKVKSFLAQASSVTKGHIVSLKKLGRVKAPDGTEFENVQLTMLVVKALKGSAQKDEKINFKVVIPAEEKAIDKLMASIRDEGLRIVVLDSADTSPIERRLFKTSAIREAQFKKALK